MSRHHCAIRAREPTSARRLGLGSQHQPGDQGSGADISRAIRAREPTSARRLGLGSRHQPGDQGSGADISRAIRAREPTSARRLGLGSRHQPGDQGSGSDISQAIRARELILGHPECGQTYLSLTSKYFVMRICTTLHHIFIVELCTIRIYCNIL